jgi:hypothetical protein
VGEREAVERCCSCGMGGVAVVSRGSALCLLLQTGKRKALSGSRWRILWDVEVFVGRLTSIRNCQMVVETPQKPYGAPNSGSVATLENKRVLVTEVSVQR